MSHWAAGHCYTEKQITYIQHESGKAKVTLIPCQMNNFAIKKIKTIPQAYNKIENSLFSPFLTWGHFSILLTKLLLV